MGAATLPERTPEERLICKALALTWVFYALGALYVVGPVLGWSLLGMAVLKVRREPWRLNAVSLNVWLWVVGMLCMELALVVAHVDFMLGTGLMIKSSIGWAKGWALMAVFIVAGALLDIRREILADAVADLGRQTVVLAPIFFMAFYAGLPARLYVSPLSVIGGPGPEYFAFNFFSNNHEGF